MAEYQIIYWRNIPAQVIVKRSRKEQVKLPLSIRFEQAIDMAAMRANLHGSEDYLTQWVKSESLTINDDDSQSLDEMAKALVQKIEIEYDQDRLKTLIKAGGVEN